MGNFACAVGRVKRYVNVGLHCIVRNLKRTSETAMLPPPLEKFLRTPMVASGARSKFGAPMFEPEIFRKQTYCIEESASEIVGTFRRPPQSFSVPAMILHPHSDSAAGELCPPCLPCYAPDYMWNVFSQKINCASDWAVWVLSSWSIRSFANPWWFKYARTHQFAKPEVFDVFIFSSACS